MRRAPPQRRAILRPLNLVQIRQSEDGLSFSFFFYDGRNQRRIDLSKHERGKEKSHFAVSQKLDTDREVGKREGVKLAGSPSGLI